MKFNYALLSRTFLARCRVLQLARRTSGVNASRVKGAKWWETRQERERDRESSNNLIFSPGAKFSNWEQEKLGSGVYLRWMGEDSETDHGSAWQGNPRKTVWKNFFMYFRKDNINYNVNTPMSHENYKSYFDPKFQALIIWNRRVFGVFGEYCDDLIAITERYINETYDVIVIEI